MGWCGVTAGEWFPQRRLPGEAALFCREIAKAHLTSEVGPLDQNQKDHDLNLPCLWYL